MQKKLVLFSIFFSVCIHVFSDGIQPNGSGTKTDPYQVAILDNLLWISTNTSSWDKYFTQAADIDAVDTQNWNNGDGFSSIGKYPDNPFTGSYNGDEYIINHLHIALPDTDYIGFFSYTDSAVISNLGLENLNVTGDQGVGGLVGWNETSILSNCYVTGNITGEQEVGGLVGYNHFSTISMCYTDVVVIGIGNNSVGGLVGFNNDASRIVNCYSISNLSGNDDIGGITGMNIYSSISNSYSICSITGNSCLGGLVGDCYESSICNSYNNGNSIEGITMVGGLVGSNITCSIINCFSTSCVIGVSNTGGLVGYNLYPDVQNSFWDIQTSGQTISAGGTGKTTSEMLDVATYTSLITVGLDFPWDFIGNPYDDTGNNDYWDIDMSINDGYPYFANPYVGIDDEDISCDQDIPELLGNFPNPFKQTTSISFSLSTPGKIELSIYNIKGEKIKSLANNIFIQGLYSLIWDGKNESGKFVRSGVYLYKLQINDETELIKKCILMR